MGSKTGEELYNRRRKLVQRPCDGKEKGDCEKLKASSIEKQAVR